MNIEPYPIKTATYNTAGVPVDYQDRMAQEMIFDNLTPKEKGEAFYEAGFECAIDKVLEIIDDVFMEVANGLIHTPSEALEEMHNRVNGLKGEQE